MSARLIPITTILVATCFLATANAQQTGALTLTVSDVPAKASTATIIIYNNGKNMSLAGKTKMASKERREWKLQHSVYDVAAENGTATARIEGLAPGEYSIMVFCDENRNQKLDTNFLGMPSEPIGMTGELMSTKPKFPPKQRPNWDNTKFNVVAGENQQNLKVFKLGR